MPFWLKVLGLTPLGCALLWLVSIFVPDARVQQWAIVLAFVVGGAALLAFVVGGIVHLARRSSAAGSTSA